MGWEGGGFFVCLWFFVCLKRGRNDSLGLQRKTADSFPLQINNQYLAHTNSRNNFALFKWWELQVSTSSKYVSNSQANPLYRRFPLLVIRAIVGFSYNEKQLCSVFQLSNKGSSHANLVLCFFF